MDAAIYQFRQYEKASLRYAEATTTEDELGGVGLWEHSVEG